MKDCNTCPERTFCYEPCEEAIEEEPLPSSMRIAHAAYEPKGTAATWNDQHSDRFRKRREEFLNRNLKELDFN